MATVVLERFQAKWSPVRVKKTRQIKNREPCFDSIETGLSQKSLGLDVGRLYDRPPFLDLRGLMALQCHWGLPVGRWRFLAQFQKSLLQGLIGQRCHDGRVQS